MSKELLETVLDNVNNDSVSDADFRKMLQDKLSGGLVIQGFTYPEKTQLQSPLLYAQESDISVVYTHDLELINEVKRTLDVYTISNEKESIIMDLVGFEDQDTEQFEMLVELFGKENAEFMAGSTIQLICLIDAM